jgi:hypothetical protein
MTCPPPARGGYVGRCWTGKCPEWQRELTVNQPPHGFEGSSPSFPTNIFNDLALRYFPAFGSKPQLGSIWEALEIRVQGFASSGPTSRLLLYPIVSFGFEPSDSILADRNALRKFVLAFQRVQMTTGVPNASGFLQSRYRSNLAGF